MGVKLKASPPPQGKKGNVPHVKKRGRPDNVAMGNWERGKQSFSRRKLLACRIANNGKTSPGGKDEERGGGPGFRKKKGLKSGQQSGMVGRVIKKRVAEPWEWDLTEWVSLTS